ncbi:uncharacterized protein PRCAT00003932001 [Priceomyces carsonii]|uniref:uncharacterized protein n=1 Tax=Priceomyces carsonii TaxID=28549 RepID=UPI002EDB278E|nr:unnamed protein product [Priceomyces carsonii]
MSEDAPQVYIATYSSTDVYECQINESPIMRRCKDDWVNATQILKCCNFPKAKRTKILEKGVQQGLHEKIQGGYGRFQGTWIPLPDAQRLAASYGVTPNIAPVLYLDLSDPNINIPKKTKQMNKDGTPVKRKYTKKAKKAEETPSKKIKSDAGSHEAPDLYGSQNQALYNSLSRYHIPTQSSQPSLQQMQYQLHQSGQIPSNFNQDFLTVNGNTNGLPTFTSHQQVVQNEFQNYQLQLQRYQQEQQKFSNLSFNTQMPIEQPLMGTIHHSKLPLSQSTNETNWSQEDGAITKDSDTSVSSNEEHSQYLKDQKVAGQNDSGDNRLSYSSQLLQFFSEDKSQIPYFLHNPPYDFNINEAIDDEGHTALHWAASIGNYPMIRLLLSKGANPLTVNNFGLNPLSKLISFNNCYELKNFPKVLDDLELCLINTDINGRTPLHYLCQFAKVKSKYESSEYYLNVILTKLTSISSMNPNKQVNLLKNVLDHQDVNGDTCLHLAVKASNLKLSKCLLSYGARDDLENVNKESVKLLLAHNNALDSYNQKVDQSHQLLTSVTQLNNIANQRRMSESKIKQQGLATPIQASFTSESLGTPDTQRTTIQDEDDDDIRQARVNREQLDHLMRGDNKENIFIDDSALKSFETTSTPSNKLSSSVLGASHQPLAVITERTVESTPIKSDDKKSGSLEFQTLEIKPPTIDDNGKIVDSVNEEGGTLTRLPAKELSSLFNVMFNSLSDSYSVLLQNFGKEFKSLNEELLRKNELSESWVSKTKSLLAKCGVTGFDSPEQGKRLLNETIANYEGDLTEKEASLLQLLEKSHAFKLANLVQEYESKDEDIDDHEDHASKNEDDKFELAVELSQLQHQRLALLKKAAGGIKCYGVDPKAYKYRKLISLSCGLNIEDIDGLIDGINDSLSETVIS